MLKLYDNDLLSDYDKTSLKKQEIAYLNASFALENPVPEILPRKIYSYKVQLDNLIFQDCGSLRLYLYSLKRHYNDLVYNRELQDYSYLWPLYVDINREYDNISVDSYQFQGALYQPTIVKDNSKILNINVSPCNIPVKIIDSSRCIVFHRDKVAYLPLLKNNLDGSLYYYSLFMSDSKKALSEALQEASYLEEEGYIIKTVNFI